MVKLNPLNLLFISALGTDKFNNAKLCLVILTCIAEVCLF